MKWLVGELVSSFLFIDTKVINNKINVSEQGIKVTKG